MINCPLHASIILSTVSHLVYKLNNIEIETHNIYVLYTDVYNPISQARTVLLRSKCKYSLYNIILPHKIQLLNNVMFQSRLAGTHTRGKCSSIDILVRLK